VFILLPFFSDCAFECGAGSLTRDGDTGEITTASICKTGTRPELLRDRLTALEGEN
jgi:hypothetical protein